MESGDWEYAAEGGANLVVRYRGPTPSPFVGKILRLRKRKLDKSPIGVSPALELPSTLLTTLLGQDLLVEAYKITLSTQFLGELNVGMIRDATRPTERATVDDIDATCESGVLMPDLTHGNRILAIEIKPKWGFLPSPSFLAKESAAVKSKYCRFCMQRDLRQSTHLESYCPLDLYSGEEGRMKLALEGLCMSWMESDGGGNNLRFSVDGAVLSPSDSSSAALLAQCLNLPESTSTSTVLQTIVSSLTSILQDSPVLSRLRSLQASLDPDDIEGLAKTFSSFTQQSFDEYSASHTDPKSLLAQPTAAEWTTSAERWELDKSLPQNSLPLTAERLRLRLMAFLLSATFKDCSIFIILRPSSTGTTGAIVKVIDLDSKPMGRLSKYLAADREIVESFRRRLESGLETRICLV